MNQRGYSKSDAKEDRQPATEWIGRDGGLLGVLDFVLDFVTDCYKVFPPFDSRCSTSARNFLYSMGLTI